MALSSQLMKQAGKDLQSALEQIGYLQDQVCLLYTSDAADE